MRDTCLLPAGRSHFAGVGHEAEESRALGLLKEMASEWHFTLPTSPLLLALGLLPIQRGCPQPSVFSKRWAPGAAGRGDEPGVAGGARWELRCRPCLLSLVSEAYFVGESSIPGLHFTLPPPLSP